MPKSPASLALAGGPPVRTQPFPSVSGPAGRTLGDEEVAAVTRVVRSGKLNSTVGTETAEFEQEFADYYGVPHAVASSSGTSAIHLAVAAVDPDPGDEIITTCLSDAGTVLPILAQNAIPVFADVDPLTGNLDPASVRARITARTKAIIVVHLFGIPAPVAELRQIADAHGVVLIEDCAQAYLTRCAPDGALAGTVGHIGCFSLQQSKHITAGDGGITITADNALARRARLFADKAWPRDTDERTHLFLGLNYRMTELQAAVARAQLGKLAGVVEDRRKSADALTAAIAPLPGLTAAPPDGTSYWQFPVFIDESLAGDNGHGYAEALVAEGIPASGGYIQRPLYLTPLFTELRTYGDSGFPLSMPTAPRYVAGLCPRAEELIIGGGLLVISWNERYTADDVADIAAALRKVHTAFTSR
ncbi:DegT/DnrJ/EryC1/StrS family aminotransferase [Kribbella sp. NBC_01245]|uniref:DegT/DnrJ/EryC1/StrS family aminotransferase n=1 Tax=Kribbella sp. NBC_01245 TaxID=2903578 RepID=UPI002E27B75C|nr:DegT/DnrJ/EryC1/StrS family aminotransferase [Kribbella sp. NBC_01245]